MRERIKGMGFRLCQVAGEAGISEITLQRWLNQKLTDVQEKRINEALDRLVERRRARDDEYLREGAADRAGKR